MELKRRLGLGSLMRKRSAHDATTIDPNADTPEANAVRGVRLFCESGAANSGEEVLHLPTIVESAVASPAAAAAAAAQIRKFLSKENYSRPHVQYNSVMLIRILADNPGESFTRNLDKQFADTVKHLLRSGHDVSVSQLVKETLDALERDKAYDTNLNTLFGMWRKERGLMENAARQHAGPRKLNAPGWSGRQQAHGGFGSGSRSSSRQLPSPDELAGRVEEARTSAKLLLQLVQSTPPDELLDNELIKEFAERCTTAQRSVQGYIACDNPSPDDDTMLTLIETNEQLSLAASKHQRAVLQARRLVRPSPPSSLNHGNSNSNNNNKNTDINNSSIPAGVPAHSYDTPSLPPRHDGPSPTYGQAPSQAPAAAPYQQRPGSNSPREEDPFADHYTASYAPPAGAPPNSNSNTNTNTSTNDYGTAAAPYHPGFQSTPSYLHRQESSANNLTMHGAQPSITEENERDYPTGQRLGAPSTPQLQHQQQQGHDVSPVADRNTVTYRY